MNNVHFRYIINISFAFFAGMSLLGCGFYKSSIPDVVGMTQSEAELTLIDSHLRVGDISEEYSATVHTGEIIRQVPTYGNKVTTNSFVALIISKGKEPIDGSKECNTSPICTKGGSGTDEDPYILCSIEDIQAIGANEVSLSAHYRLGCDIDASATINWNANTGFIPIGYANWMAKEIVPFKGSLDGAGHSICDLYINASGLYGAGLFGVISKTAFIHNLGIDNCDVSLSSNRDSAAAGGLVGFNNGGMVSNCYATATVTVTDIDSTASAGGLVGTNWYGTVTDCYAKGKVSSTGKYADAGGIVGDNGNGTVIDCYSTATVTATTADIFAFAGGLVGTNGTVTGCYSTGKVLAKATGEDASASAGGLVGWNIDGTATNCYATGPVSVLATGETLPAGASAGGLVGRDQSGTMTDCYAIGKVSSTGKRAISGGLVGTRFYSTVKNCFWDVTSSEIFVSDGGIGLTTSEMQQISTYEGVEWDFKVFWAMEDGNGYPVFRKWQKDMLNGEGTVTNPFYITTIEELQYLCLAPSMSHFQLMNNIDAIDTNEWWGGKGFAPILLVGGSFDGNGYVIKNLMVNRPGEGSVGLFSGIIANGVLRNLGLQNTHITGDLSGGIVGVNQGVVINCYATGYVSSESKNSYAGGLIGKNINLVKNCYATCAVTSSVAGTGFADAYAGGLIGGNDEGTVSDCYATGTVTVTGENASVTAAAGGFIGINKKGTVTNCFSAGDISASVTGNIVSDVHAGGFMGNNEEGNVTNCFWDIMTAGIITSSEGTSLITLSMLQQSKFVTAGWDFTGTWSITPEKTYPWLRVLDYTTTGYPVP